jgi:hypothetical protein
MTRPASDTFSGTDGQNLTDYNSNWVLNSGTFQIQSSSFRSAAASTECAARWNDITGFAADQYSQIKFIRITDAPTYAGPAVRLANGPATYYGYYSNYYERYLLKNINGTVTYLASFGTQVNDQSLMRLEISGSTLTPKIDGSMDSALGAHSDSALASGWAGICGWWGGFGNGSRGDDFLADNIGEPAPPLIIQEPALFPNPRMYFHL